MGISIFDLPPKAQEQAARQIAEQEARKKLLQTMRETAASQKAAPNRKYRNVPDTRTTEKGTEIRFDSKKEARRYDELMLLLKAGQIHELKLQPQFTLQEAYTTPTGERVRAIRYVADFSYNTGGGLVVEDTKSKVTKTRVYEIKRKLMREKFGISITEV